MIHAGFYVVKCLVASLSCVKLAQGAVALVLVTLFSSCCVAEGYILVVVDVQRDLAFSLVGDLNGASSVGDSHHREFFLRVGGWCSVVCSADGSVFCRVLIGILDVLSIRSRMFVFYKTSYVIGKNFPFITSPFVASG
jgi:hypothetical protein